MASAAAHDRPQHRAVSSALLIVAGLAGLILGADLLVRGGAALASHLGVRPIVVGLTVVSLGTSLPELAIGIDAASNGGLCASTYRR